MGVARVNGDLAVSRAFGDAQHKTTGGLSIDLQFKSRCLDTANVLFLLRTSSCVRSKSNRSLVVLHESDFQQTFETGLEITGPEPQDHPVCAAPELKESRIVSLSLYTG